MKKTLLTLILIFSPTLAFASPLYCVTGSGTAAVNGTYSDSGFLDSFGGTVYKNGAIYLMRANDGNSTTFADVHTGTVSLSHMYFRTSTGAGAGDIDALLAFIIAAQPFSWTLGNLGTAPDPTIAVCTPPPPVIDQIIYNASSTFANTLGVSVPDVVSWTGDNFIKIFIGSGLALLYYLRGWIVALIIIAAVVYLAYRAFRFYHV